MKSRILATVLLLCATAQPVFATDYVTDTVQATLERSGGGEDASLVLTFSGPVQQTPVVTGSNDVFDNRYGYQSILVNLGDLTGRFAATSPVFPVYLYQNGDRRGFFLQLSGIPLTGTDPDLPGVTSINFLTVDISAPESVFDFEVITAPDPTFTDGFVSGSKTIESFYLPLIVKNLVAGLASDPEIQSSIVLGTNQNDILFGAVESFSVVVVPLPAPAWLLLSALAAMGLRSRSIRAA